MTERSTFIALPHYGELTPESLPGLTMPSQRSRVILQLGHGSLLALVFNRLWCQALNDRQERRLTHFAMHHADVQAPPCWLDTLIDEQERAGADILSVSLPIKDGRGLSSTGIRRPDTGEIRRLTMKELHELPATFSAKDIDPSQWLMINTGLWVCDFTRPWVEEVCFSILDQTCRDGRGNFEARTLPEDWNFSGWAARQGLKVYATRIIPAVHHGRAAYPNDTVWGDWPTDRGDRLDEPKKYGDKHSQETRAEAT